MVIQKGKKKWGRKTRVKGISTLLSSVKCGVLGSVQFSSVAQSCPTLCDPMNHSTPGLPVHHQQLESTQTHVHRVGDAIQPSHPLPSPSPSALNLPHHQRPFTLVSSSHQVARILEFELQHQSYVRLLWEKRGTGFLPEFKIYV